MLNSIKGRSRGNNYSANALKPEIDGVSSAGFNSTVRNIGLGSVVFACINLHNNDGTAAWLQVFFRPADEVVLGTTPPDVTFKFGGNESRTQLFVELPIGSGSRMSVAVTTSETGATGVTSAMTGNIFYA